MINIPKISNCFQVIFSMRSEPLLPISEVLQRQDLAIVMNFCLGQIDSSRNALDSYTVDSENLSLTFETRNNVMLNSFQHLVFSC
jgi:hypothetical protein